MSENYLDLYEKALTQALEEKSDFCVDVDDFNKGLDHILDLLQSAVNLFCAKQHNIATFLAITALEEKTKLEIYSYQSTRSEVDKTLDNTPSKKRGILYNHKIKHRLAPSPVLFMGTRLQEQIGEARLYQLIDQARERGFRDERESALYIDFNADNTIVFPKEAITPVIAKEFLLFAIEVVDDGLVGYTEYSIKEVSKELEHLWNQVCEKFDSEC